MALVDCSKIIVLMEMIAGKVEKEDMPERGERVAGALPTFHLGGQGEQMCPV